MRNRRGRPSRTTERRPPRRDQTGGRLTWNFLSWGLMPLPSGRLCRPLCLRLQRCLARPPPAESRLSLSRPRPRPFAWVRQAAHVIRLPLRRRLLGPEDLLARRRRRRPTPPRGVRTGLHSPPQGTLMQPRVLRVLGSRGRTPSMTWRRFPSRNPRLRRPRPVTMRLVGPLGGPPSRRRGLHWLRRRHFRVSAT